MSTHSIKTAGITRTGFEYQDLIGIEVLIDFYRDRELYQWVKLEAEDNGYLDDVVALRGDGSLELTQVKFTVDPERYPLCWEWLLEKRPKGTSLLCKWGTSLNTAAGTGRVHAARLRTNRRPDAAFTATLEGNVVSLDKLPLDTRRAVEAELGGANAARAFFERFEFVHSEAMIDRLEARLRALVVPTDTDANGWLLLRAHARTWATRRFHPEPDGCIRHQHLVQIITKKRPQPIPQDFQVPAVYCVPRQSFHDAFMARIRQGKHALSVLWGSPGRGKSTYLSFLVDQLRKEDIPVIRHHYFLSLQDSTPDRIAFSDIAASLMHQMGMHYPDAIKGHEEDSAKLPDWITACGAHFRVQGKPFVIVVDGLDHVWREPGSVQQMEHLFNYLLPCPPNVLVVVGTQRVSEAHLPRRLVQQSTEEDWLEIPPMDESAVHEWVRGQHVGGRVRIRDMDGNAKRDQEELGRIGQALFDISEGHPLHLIYSFEALVRRGAFVSEEEVRLLPPCPGNDIRKYYVGLWQRLSPGARQALHLIAGAEFHWPPDGLRQCAGPIDEIDHLLEHRRSGLVPFHGSMLAYARDLPEHDATFRSLLPKTIEWLEKDAPEMWRWGWLWIMQARSGDAQNLLEKTTRDWTVASLVQGWSRTQIITILREAERIAFGRRDYCRAIELRMLKTRLLNGLKYQCNRYPEFEETAIRHHHNDAQLLHMADRLSTLAEEEVVTLSRSAAGDSVDIRADCTAEMTHRVNLWLTLRHHPLKEFKSLSKCLFETLALNGDSYDAAAVVNFIGQFGDGDEMLGVLLDLLTRERRLSALEAMQESMKGPKKQRWRGFTQMAMVRVASLEGVELKYRLKEPAEPISPLLACYLRFHKAKMQPRPAPLLVAEGLVKQRYDYGRVPLLEEFFHDVFFTTLAARLVGNDPEDWEVRLKSVKGAEWLIDAARLLQGTATRIGRGELQLSFATPFYAARVLEPADGGRFSDPETVQYHAFRHALRQIAIDLHCLKAPAERRCLVSADELARARASAHWVEEMWLADQVERGFLLLDVNTAREALAAYAARESKKVTVFNERADRWVELARYSLLYGLPQTAEMLKRAAECVLGYGWRKDLWASEVLAMIMEIHKYSAGDGLLLLRALAPIVEQITAFTDGDETNHVRSELIDAVAEITPGHLPALYAHHIREDEHRYAAQTLEAHCRVADLTDSSGKALARTLVEAREVVMLSDLTSEGKAGAAEAERSQAAFLGGIAPPKAREVSSEPSTNIGSVPDIAKFGPTEFEKFVEAMLDYSIDYELRRQALRRWPRYWMERGEGLKALAAARAYFEAEENPHAAEEMLDALFAVSLALEGPDAAYPWLVRAHVHHYGWQRYWSSHEETLRRLKLAAENYGNRWEAFIDDTSKPSRYWQKREHTLSIGTENLVHFLLFCGQKELAIQFAKTCVAIVQQEVRDQPIPECPWFH